MNKLEKIKFRFRFIEEGEPDLKSYGVYRLGLLSEEINEYLMARTNSLNVKRLRKRFDEIAGRNTCACTPDGRMLMYRWDVQRFADVLFKKTKETYFD